MILCHPAPQPPAPKAPKAAATPPATAPPTLAAALAAATTTRERARRLRPAHDGEAAALELLLVFRAPLLLSPALQVLRRAVAPGEGIAVNEHAVRHPLIGSVHP